MLVITAPALGYVSGKRVWLRTSGTAAHERWFDAIAKGPSGAFYAGGSDYVSALNNYDLLLVKYRSDGSRAWTKRWAGAGTADDGVAAMASDGGGNVYATGYSATATDGDFVTLKYSATGVRRWATMWFGVAGKSCNPVGLAVDTAGNVYVAGSVWLDATHAGIVVIKYDAAGVEQWVTHYDPDPLDPKAGSIWPSDIAVDAAGDVYVTGSSMYDTINEALTLKFAGANGAKLFGQVYDAAVGSWASAVAVRGDAVVITGWAAQASQAEDCLVVKYDLSLNEQYRLEYANPAGARDFGDDVAISTGGIVYVTGCTNRPPAGGSGYYNGCQTIKVAADGSGAVWSRIYQPSGTGAEGDELVLDGSGNAYIAGYLDTDTSEEDLLVLKYSSAGTRKWARTWRDTGKDDDGAGGIVLGGTRALYVAGYGTARGSFERAVAMRFNR